MMIRSIAAFAGAAALALFGVYRCSWLPIRCSMRVATSERELVAAADNRFGRVVAAHDSLARLNRCDTERPLSVDPPLLNGLAYRFLGEHEQSIIWYERALAVDRRPEVYSGLGVEQGRAGKREEGLRTLVLACAFAPSMLNDIEDGVVREEVQRRLIAEYGKEWIGERASRPQ